MVQFEPGTKRPSGIGPSDPAKVAEGTVLFQKAAVLLDRHLETHDWQTGTKPGHADVRMARVLPFNDVMRQLLPDHTPR